MIKKITRYDWPDTIGVPDGSYITQVPDITRENLEFLAAKFNSLLDCMYARGKCPCGSEREYKNCCGEI